MKKWISTMLVMVMMITLLPTYSCSALTSQKTASDNDSIDT